MGLQGSDRDSDSPAKGAKIGKFSGSFQGLHKYEFNRTDSDCPHVSHYSPFVIPIFDGVRSTTWTRCSSLMNKNHARISIKNHLNIHSWMVSSEADLNWSYPSGNNRMKIYFSWMEQVRNLPTRGLFFLIRIRF
jgi:hypothetical protein